MLWKKKWLASVSGGESVGVGYRLTFLNRLVVGKRDPFRRLGCRLEGGERKKTWVCGDRTH